MKKTMCFECDAASSSPWNPSFSASRISCTIFGAQYRIKIQGPLLKNYGEWKDARTSNKASMKRWVTAWVIQLWSWRQVSVSIGWHRSMSKMTQRSGVWRNNCEQHFREYWPWGRKKAQYHILESLHDYFWTAQMLEIGLFCFINSQRYVSYAWNRAKLFQLSVY